MNALLQLDQTLFVWINTHWSNPVFDLIMPLISHLGDRYLVWLWMVLIGLLMIRQEARLMRAVPGGGQVPAMMKAIGFLCLYLALIYVVNTEAYRGLKQVFHRPRPFIQQTVVLRVPSTDVLSLSHSGSMPSGHACGAFMLAALFAERFRRKRYVFYCLAASVALSRVYLGVHYPSDVIAGACLGLAITWLMLLLQRRWEKNKETWSDSSTLGED
jgi:undecaprenyl-diphosphatase